MREAQRRSFVYGNTKLANDEITEEMVNEIGEASTKNLTTKSKKGPLVWSLLLFFLMGVLWYVF